MCPSGNIVNGSPAENEASGRGQAGEVSGMSFCDRLATALVFRPARSAKAAFLMGEAGFEPAREINPMGFLVPSVCHSATHPGLVR